MAKRLEMKFPELNTTAINKLNGIHLLIYVAPALPIAAIVFLANGDKENTLFYIALIAVIVIFSLYVGYKAHLSSEDKLKASFDNLSAKITEMSNQIGTMSTALDNMNEHLKLTSFGDTKFSANDFKNIWRTLTFHTNDSFYAMSYMAPIYWQTDTAKNQIKGLASIQGMGGIKIKRLFVLDSADELKELEEILKMHIENDIDVKYILSDGNKDLQIGINISDEIRGALFYYTTDRAVDGGQLLYKASEVRRYIDIFNKAWSNATRYKVPVKPQ